mmetsp:Transcript_6988/g.11437  ORF Transcript_6988/g.11437 Transcript_6988/m.11437 type:complete len:85 (-) Transcript_6988:1385-1639(-)
MRQDLLLSDDRRFTPESTADLGRAAVFAAMLPPSCQDLMRDEDGNSIHLSERFCFRKAKLTLADTYPQERNFLAKLILDSVSAS